MNENLRSIVRKCFGTESREQRDSPGELAEVISVCDRPSFGLKRADGSTYSWIQSLTRAATPEEEVAYWKGRAELAESRNKGQEAGTVTNNGAAMTVAADIVDAADAIVQQASNLHLSADTLAHLKMMSLEIGLLSTLNFITNSIHAQLSLVVNDHKDHRAE